MKIKNQKAYGNLSNDNLQVLADLKDRLQREATEGLHRKAAQVGEKIKAKLQVKKIDTLGIVS